MRNTTNATVKSNNIFSVLLSIDLFDDLLHPYHNIGNEFFDGLFLGVFVIIHDGKVGGGGASNHRRQSTAARRTVEASDGLLERTGHAYFEKRSNGFVPLLQNLDPVNCAV